MTALATDGRRKFEVVGGTKVAEFLLSNNTFDIIQGDIGSGKTRALCARIMRHGQQQRVSKMTGLRMSRWAVVRNTYPDLKRSTIRTWLEMFPEQTYGRFNWGQPPFHRIKFGDVLLEVDFFALDKPEDVSKLRSTEYTGIAFNEIPFMPKEIVDEADSRLRYPGEEHGGSEWHGIIADANAPPEDHWLALMSGQVDLPPNLTDEERAEFTWPPGWNLFMQPPALLEQLDHNGRLIGYDVNPNAENLKNLPPNYYSKMIHGKSKAWIDCHLRNTVTLVVDGSPVFPMFRKEVHIAGAALRPVVGQTLSVGLDFGRQPAAIFGQAVNNRVLIQNELLGFDEGSTTFAPKVKRFIAKHYPDHRLEDVQFWGDPKGQDRGQTDERTSYQIFEANGMCVRPAPGLKNNMIETRIEAVTSVLNEMVDARPRGVFSPMCRTLNVGMQGRYCLERDEGGELKPVKRGVNGRYSNPCDALQYLVLGMGEGRAMVGRDRLLSTRPVKAWKGHHSMRRVS